MSVFVLVFDVFEIKSRIYLRYFNKNAQQK